MSFVSETEKVVYSKKIYIAMLGLIFLPLLFLVSSEGGLRAGDASAASEIPADDGWQLIITSMNFALHIFAPLLCALVASDTIAGEKANGMLSLSLTKKVSRNAYLTKKIVVQVFVVIVTFVVFAISSFVFGSIIGFETFFGVKNETGLPSTSTVIPDSEIWWRMLFFYGFAAFGTLVVVALAIMFSTYSDSVANVTALTLIVYMSSEIFGGMIAGSGYYEFLLSPAIKNMVWNLLVPVIDWNLIVQSFFILLIYLIGALSLTYYRFGKQDL